MKTNLNLQNSDGATALHLATKRGFHNICELLILEGIDIDTQDNSLATALHYASEEGHVDIV